MNKWLHDIEFIRNTIKLIPLNESHKEGFLRDTVMFSILNSE